MITMKRTLIAALLLVGALAGSYRLYAGSSPQAVSDAGCCPEDRADCRSCDTPCCGK